MYMYIQGEGGREVPPPLGGGEVCSPEHAAEIRNTKLQKYNDVDGGGIWRPEVAAEIRNRGLRVRFGSQKTPQK